MLGVKGSLAATIMMVEHTNYDSRRAGRAGVAARRVVVKPPVVVAARGAVRAVDRQN